MINELSKGLMLQESKVNELKTKVDVLTKEKSRLNERNQEFLDGNKALLKSFHQGRLQYHEEKTSKNELQTKVDNLIRENKELKSSVNEFKTKVDCLSEEKSQLNEELILTLKSYNEEKTSKNELQTKVDNLILENSRLKRINGIISDDLKKQFETQSNQKAYINPDDYVFDHEMVIKKEIKEEKAE